MGEPAEDDDVGARRLTSGTGAKPLRLNSAPASAGSSSEDEWSSSSIEPTMPVG